MQVSFSAFNPYSGKATDCKELKPSKQGKLSLPTSTGTLNQLVATFVTQHNKTNDRICGLDPFSLFVQKFRIDALPKPCYSKQQTVYENSVI